MNYSISRESSLEQIGRRGGGSISFKVRGYWSGDSITVYVSRTYARDTKAPWTFSVNHSSGGRDTAEVATDAEAVRYFAEALVGASVMAENMMANVDQLEAFYQDQCALDKADRDAELAAHAARVEADTAITVEQATALVDRLAAASKTAENMYHGVPHALFVRGVENQTVTIKAVTRGKTKFYYNGNICARKALIEKVATYSARSLTA